MTASEQLAYMAGFFDGEGTICIRRLKDSKRRRASYTLAIAVTQNERAPLELFLTRFGGVIYNHKWQKAMRTFFSWQATNAPDKTRFLETISPYLIVKKREAELALAFLATMVPRNQRSQRGIGPEHVKRIAKRHAMWVECRAIKRRRSILGINDGEDIGQQSVST